MEATKSLLATALAENASDSGGSRLKNIGDDSWLRGER